jgi:hypothetical protein
MPAFFAPRPRNPGSALSVFSPIPIAMYPRCWLVRSCLLFAAVALPALLHAAPLDPPQLRCTAVDAAGGATLTWIAPPDPANEFQAYEVYRADAAAGPYVLLGSIPTWGQTTYTDLTANANAAPRWYYLLTLSNSAPPNTSVPSDTLATIFLQVTQSVPLGSAVADWNLPHEPLLATAAAFTQVDLEHPLGTWALTDSVDASLHHWSQVVSVCDDSLNFRVRIPDASGCTSQSNAHGAAFQDITPPSIPILVYVSVDTAANQSVLEWEPSPELDTQGYIIVWSAPGGNTIIDTVYGRLNTSYQWLLSQAGTGPEAFTIAAIDTCERGNPPSPNTSATLDPHATVFLSTAFDPCAATIRVVRTPYVGWPVDHYELFVSVDNGPFALLASLPPDLSDQLLPNVQPDHAYCFVMQAYGAAPGQFSRSNKTCRSTTYPAVPQWNYLRNVTVLAPDRIQITDSVELAPFTRQLVLERSANGAPWKGIDSVASPAIPVITFLDEDVATAERSYSYRVAAQDSCGQRTTVSNTGNSILLTTDPGLDGLNRLYWNGYVAWAGNITAWNVYRSIADGPFLPLGTTAADTWQFADNVQGLFGSPGKFCYYVEGLEGGNPSGINAITVSNTACTVQQEEIWVPNAFISGGANPVFKPVLAYADAVRYEFTVFNRWGQQIWTTTDREQAWDGRLNGNFVPQGVYAWYCSFINGAGKTVERKGTVTFLQGP